MISFSPLSAGKCEWVYNSHMANLMEHIYIPVFWARLNAKYLGIDIKFLIKDNLVI